jgi:hypothetical protein
MSDLFSTEDLAEHGDAILERVRAGAEVRLYDPQGFDLTLARTDCIEAAREIAAVCATLLVLLRARGQAPGGEPMSVVDYGAWPWLRHLDSERLDDFLSDIAGATVVAAREGAADSLNALLSQWRSDAEALSASTSPPARTSVRDRFFHRR